MWGNSTTIWAVNETTDKLEAYQKSDGTEDNDKDITLDSANADPAGIWSDDTTIWVADHADDKLYAYTLSNGDRDSSKDIDTSTSGNENPRGLWGEGDTIWVTDEDDDRVYSYNLVDNPQQRRHLVGPHHQPQEHPQVRCRPHSLRGGRGQHGYPSNRQGNRQRRQGQC